jgi:hypothetical protein
MESRSTIRKGSVSTRNFTRELLRQETHEEFHIQGQKISHESHVQGSMETGIFTFYVDGEFRNDLNLDYNVISNGRRLMNLSKLYSTHTAEVLPSMMNVKESKALVSAISAVAKTKRLEIVTHDGSLGKELSIKGLKIRTIE